MTDNNPPKERRLHARYRVDTPLALGPGANDSAQLVDLSMSGLACVSPRAFDEMAILEISMKLPHPDGPMDFKAGGAVVRSEPSEEHEGQHSVALFFTHMDDANRQTLAEFIKVHAEPTG
ncbi:MAG: hypothetical protein DHS20C15_00390 [Planctomycetota bacterium]|nr:MAG: hypothetical protein DHS20C15_00390 [Planctomycetota bacterium]